jgi:hypothetical protein
MDPSKGHWDPGKDLLMKGGHMVEWFRRHTAHGLGIVLMLGFFLLPPVAWASTQVGNAVLQAWYRQRHTFQTDSFDHVDWVQWRNEVFGWLIYDDIIEDGLLFNQIKIPLVEYATFNTRYRFRYDPVYRIRDHYKTIYDNETAGSFINPENDFLSTTMDLDFGEIGPGRLSARIGNQVIVWGEADFLPSLDRINALRIDQTTGIGEKLDELRKPLPALKVLYDIGTVGKWFSEITLEGWYSPRYRTAHSAELIVEEGWRIPFHMRSCWVDGQEVPYSIDNCKDSRQFLPYRPDWLPTRRTRHPWHVTRRASNAKSDVAVFGCAGGTDCRSDASGERFSAVVNEFMGRGHHHHRGWDNHSGGFRILGKTFFSIDFTLNYMYIHGMYGLANPVGFFRNKTWGDLRPDTIYGDFGIIPDGNGGVLPPAGSFEDGLRRCLSPTGKTNDGGGRLDPREHTFLTGADLRGFDWPERLLDADGNPMPGAQPHAARLPMTACDKGFAKHLPTNVFGFTLTYNDFKYTGAVFRTEQSLTTSEIINTFPPGSPNPRTHKVDGVEVGFDETPGSDFANESYRNRVGKTTWTWRSLIAMDMLKAYTSYRALRWMRPLPGQIGTNQSFFTTQWFVQYHGEAIANSRHIGTGNVGIPGQRGHRWYRWNHLITVATGGYGYFRGKLENRMAWVYEPRGKQHILFGQWWWRNLLGHPNWEVSGGIAWKPSSMNDENYLNQQFYTNRDLFWGEFTWYLL